MTASYKNKPNDKLDAPTPCPFKNCKTLNELMKMYVDAERRATEAEQKLQILLDGIAIGRASSIFPKDTVRKKKRIALKQGITTLKVDVPGDFSVKCGTVKDECVISAPADVIDCLAVKQNGAQLSVTARRGFECDGELRISIALTTSLDELSVRSSADVAVNEMKSDDATGIRLEGSGNVTVGSVVAGRFFIAVAGSSNIEAKIDCRNTEAEIGGSGNVVLNGKTETFSGVVSGSGTLRVSRTENGNIQLSGSGDVFIHATKSLCGTVIGSGSIGYKGCKNPKIQIIGSGIAFRE